MSSSESYSEIPGLVSILSMAETASNIVRNEVQNQRHLQEVTEYIRQNLNENLFEIRTLSIGHDSVIFLVNFYTSVVIIKKITSYRAEMEARISQRAYQINPQLFPQIYRTDNFMGKTYIMMEYLKNHIDLFTALTRNMFKISHNDERGFMLNASLLKPIDKCLMQIKNGILDLHRNGITHGDIKLENIMIDSDYNIKIIDFGLSDDFEESVTAIGGTDEYFDPCLKKKINNRQPITKIDRLKADLWCFGITICILFLGSYFSTSYGSMEEYHRNFIPENAGGVHDVQCYLSYLEHFDINILTLLNSNPKFRKLK